MCVWRLTLWNICIEAMLRSGSGVAGHRGASRIVVVGNHRLIALIGVPVNVTLVMIQDQHRPVLAMGLPLAADLLLSIFQPHHRFASSIRVGSGVDRIL